MREKVPRPIQTRFLHIAGDESSHTGQHDFLVYGTLSCDRKDVSDLLSVLEEFSGGPTELKWNWLTRRNKKRYRTFISALFELIRNRKKLWFRCVVINVNETMYRDNLALGLKKFIFLNLITYARSHAKVPVEIDVILDNQGDFSLNELRERLNHRDAEEHGRTTPAFVSIVPADSKSNRLVQAADILTGAVAYVFNRHHITDTASPHKLVTANLIAQYAQIPVVDSRHRAAGIQPGDIETLGLETARHVAIKGMSIWPVDWEAERIAKVRSESASQLSQFHADQTFEELRRAGKIFDLMCPRCGHTLSDIGQHERARERTVGHPPSPPCSRPRAGYASCQTPAVVVLRR